MCQLLSFNSYHHLIADLASTAGHLLPLPHILLPGHYFEANPKHCIVSSINISGCITKRQGRIFFVNHSRSPIITPKEMKNNYLILRDEMYRVGNTVNDDITFLYGDTS